MRVAVMTAGSRGDVAPYTGLGHGLASAGHEVTLVTHAPFAALAAASGLGFHPLPVDPRAELASPRGRTLRRSTTAAGKLISLAGLAHTLVGRLLPELVAAAERADVVLVSAPLAPLGHTIAQGLGRPSMGVFLQPVAATREFAPAVVGTRSLGPAGNHLAGRAVNAAVDQIFAAANRTLRARLGLTPLPSHAARRAREAGDWPVQHGFSPLVVARPRDWRPGLRVAGYWWPHDPPAPRLPDRLEAFLDAGPPPVFVGFGSITVPQPRRLSATIAAALRAAGLRGVFQRGWSGLRADGPDMLTVDEVPHSALFPRMAAVVHHAGAGTTAAGLRAGVPAVPVPVQFDAGFWAARLAALGVAPAVVPLRGLTLRPLATALRTATADPGYARRARALAARLESEDGIGPVLAELDRLTA